MKKIFLTFADARMHKALERVTSQAEKMGVYDYVLATNETTLDLRFREKYKEQLVVGSRGYGYWCWKPQIILQTLLQMDDGDILHYMDAGCHLNSEGKNRLMEYFEIARISKIGILGFQAIAPKFHNKRIKLPDLAEKKWTKGDLFDYFDVRSKKNIVDSQTIGATTIIIKKNPSAVKLIMEWQSVYEKNFSYINDDPSISKNLDGFVEHRHDQSIFSILSKLYGVDTVSAYEYWYPGRYIKYLPDWNLLRKYPIHARRDKGVALIKKPLAFIKRVINRVYFEIKRHRIEKFGSHK